MLLAQLCRKVPHQFEGMEDVLTSSVFGLLRYLPSTLASDLLTRWAGLPLQPHSLSVEFWPCFPTPPGFAVFIDASDRGDTEPDVIVRSQEWLVLVEVNYRSHLDAAYDQLGREFVIGYRLAEREGRRFRLLVLTADVLPPRPGGLDLATGIQQALAQVQVAGTRVTDEMIEAYRSLSRAAARPDLSAGHQRLLEDTCALLELRGLRPYSARPLARAMERWARTGIPAHAWRSPMSYRYRAAVSLSAGWQALRNLDASRLHPVAWKLDRMGSGRHPRSPVALTRRLLLRVEGFPSCRVGRIERSRCGAAPSCCPEARMIGNHDWTP